MPLLKFESTINRAIMSGALMEGSRRKSSRLLKAQFQVKINSLLLAVKADKYQRRNSGVTNPEFILNFSR